MAAYSFHTIQSNVQGVYKEKGSKFISLAYPVRDEGEIRAILEAVRKEYFDARHHCYAWMLGPDKKMFRANDDGEPNHSAGTPILGQIRSRDLTNILVVVVRYFGGTKLGVGGLVSAYKTATDDALKNAVIIEREVYENLTLVFPYVSTPEVMRLIKDFDLTIERQEFEETCRMQLGVRLKHVTALEEKLALLSATGTEVTRVV